MFLWECVGRCETCVCLCVCEMRDKGERGWGKGQERRVGDGLGWGCV